MDTKVDIISCVKNRNFLPLLFMLEQKYVKIKNEKNLLTDSDLLNLVHFALDWEGKEYWPELAVNWLQEGLKMNLETKNKLEKITKDKSYSQRFRHKCMKLL